MGRAWSLDLRRRAVDAYENGEGTLEEVAERFIIGRTTLCDLLRLYRATGSLEPGERGRRPRSVDDAGRELLQELVSACPDATLAELKEAYNARATKTISRTTLADTLTAMKITRKKRLSKPRSKTVLTSKKHASLSPAR